eukprot:1383269-Amorphochlora_amoeboformis.AAC.1
MNITLAIEVDCSSFSGLNHNFLRDFGGLASDIEHEDARFLVKRVGHSVRKLASLWVGGEGAVVG